MATSALRVTVTGDKELARRFDQLSAAMRGKTLERALVAGALIVANDAKRRAPVLTGNLRRSIHVGGYGAAGGLESGTTGTDIGGNRSTATSAEVLVGTNVEYARYPEFGTSKMAARPFVRPALDENRDAVVREVDEALRDLLRSVTR